MLSVQDPWSWRLRHGWVLNRQNSRIAQCKTLLGAFASCSEKPSLHPLILRFYIFLPEEQSHKQWVCSQPSFLVFDLRTLRSMQSHTTRQSCQSVYKLQPKSVVFFQLLSGGGLSAWRAPLCGGGKGSAFLGLNVDDVWCLFLTNSLYRVKETPFYS